jgi:hypothetical protein
MIHNKKSSLVRKESFGYAIRIQETDSLFYDYILDVEKVEKKYGVNCNDKIMAMSAKEIDDLISSDALKGIATVEKSSK